MKKILTLLLTVAIVLMLPMSVKADTTVDIGKPSAPDSGVDPGGGGGGSSGGEDPGPPPDEVVPKLPSEILVTPRVTALHSLNALLAKDMDGKDLGVYFVPSLKDFPVNLKDTASYVVDYNNVVHEFAAVYDGYFDTEVEYVAAANTESDTGQVGRLQTSKKVYSSVDNTRTLNLLGYDLLLSNEYIEVSNNGKQLSATYKPVLVGTSPLSTDTVIMNLYKALYEDEWDIKFMWVEDLELALDTSPIQKEISVAISDKLPEGIDVSEGRTYVWATRTNPLLYWNKAKKDAIFDGGAHAVTNTTTKAYVGSEVSVSFSKSEKDTMNFGEFCAIARAMMDLYGEPVMTAEEQLVMIQTYGLSLPSCQDKEIYDSVTYLAAKGIINPEDTDLSKTVTFADIEPILVRIADKDSRLTFKETTYNKNSELFKKGYVSAKTSLSEGIIDDIDQVNSDITTRYNDFFVECDDDLTNFVLTSETGEKILASDNVMCNGFGSASTDVWNSPDDDPSDVYPFEFKGVVDNFYHFKVSQDLTDITISYERDLSKSEYTLNRESYSLPNSDGGVYLVENGNWAYYSFDEAADKTYTTTTNNEEVTKTLPEYSLFYVDNSRRNNPSVTELADFGYMSTYNWVYMVLDDAGKNGLAEYSYNGISLKDLGAMTSGSVSTIDNPSSAERIYVKYMQTDEQEHTYIFQVTYGKNVFMKYLTHTSGVTNVDVTATNAYFCPDDNSVLVSYDFLKSKGLVSGMQKLSDDKGYVLTLSNVTKTNVVLRQDLGIIIVGNTMYKTDELLYYTAAEKAYINYRACLGWTYDYLVLNNNGNIQLTAKSKIRDISRKSIAMTSFYPSSTVGLQGIRYEGETYLSMSGLNPIGNYLVVTDDTNNTDYLFMWKRKEYALPNNSTVQSYGDDSEARKKFKDMTGFDLGVSNDYVLMATAMFHSDLTTTVGNFMYATKYSYDSNGVKGVNRLGWLYKPNTYNSYDEATTAYLNTSSASMLPIARVGPKFVNLNINMCSVTPIDDILPYGQMPSNYAIPARLTEFSQAKSKINKIDIATLGYYKQTTSKFETLSDVVIHPAPVGLFGDLYGLPKGNLGQVMGGSKAVYYGSQLLSIDKVYGELKLLLGPNKILVDMSGKTELNALLIGTGTDAIYSYGTESVGVNQELKESLDNVTNVITDANKLIDWETFKFRRLVKNLDEWSSIALIFALNVLPRIGMALFFVLIILSLIKTWRPWIRFCHSVFDIYKFLSLGRISVDTVNTGRLVFHSMIGLAVFIMILDGLLFNFILWIAEFVILLMQR